MVTQPTKFTQIVLAIFGFSQLGLFDATCQADEGPRKVYSPTLGPQSPAGFYKGVIDLGVVKAGDRMKFDVEVLHQGSESTSFDGIRSGCRCTTVNPDRGTIRPLEPFTFHADVEVPNLMHAIWGQVYIVGLDGGRDHVIVEMKMTLSRAAVFQTRGYTREFDVDNVPKAIRVPVVRSPDINFDEIRAKFAPATSLNRRMPEVSVLDDAFVFNSNPTVMKEHGYNGRLELWDGERRLDSILFNTGIAGELEVYPRLLRFVTDEDGLHVARLILLNNTYDPSKNWYVTVKDSPIKIEAEVLNATTGRCVVGLTSTASNTADIANDQNGQPVSFIVRCGAVSQTISVPIYFPTERSANR